MSGHTGVETLLQGGQCIKDKLDNPADMWSFEYRYSRFQHI